MSWGKFIVSQRINAEPIPFHLGSMMRKKGEQKITTTKSFDIKRTTDIGFQKKKSFFAKGFWFNTLSNTEIFLTGLIVNTIMYLLKKFSYHQNLIFVFWFDNLEVFKPVCIGVKNMKL